MKIKYYTDGVTVEAGAREQLKKLASLPFIYKHVAVMPDVHIGRGSTIGSVIPTVDAIIPAAVGVDLGCGMIATKTNITAHDLPDNLYDLRNEIENSVPVGRTAGGSQHKDNGSWKKEIPADVENIWNNSLLDGFHQICERYPSFDKSNHINHLGTLGGGNHFIEICIDEKDCVWIMLHSGSRGIGNRIGSHFISKAKKEMEKWCINLPDNDLAYLPACSEYFGAYVQSVSWAQKFALLNREIMMERALRALQQSTKPVITEMDVVSCHHNYISRERHFGKSVWITRKGAVSAQQDEMGIIPGAMGRKSFIVKGKGNRDSFCSCSHGAGRLMSRTEARKTFTLGQHIDATKNLECRKDNSVIDETPMAYKNIDDVMNAQKDLVDIVHTLTAVVCIKG